MRRRLLITTLTFLLCYGVNAQVNLMKSIEETKALSAKCIKLFADGKINESFTELQKYWPMPTNEISALESQTIRSFNVIGDRYGIYEGYEKLEEEKIGNFAFRETYIIRYKYNALRVVYTYYKNNSGWILNSFMWDDQFAQEFEKVPMKN